MPFANEHNARQQDPDGYMDLRIEKDRFAPGIHAVYGVTEDGTSELQALRFSVARWTVVDAKAWLEERKYKVDTFEEAVSGLFGMCGTGTEFQVASRKRRKNGISSQKFRKEIAHIGKFVTDGREVIITHDAFDHWVMQFSRMNKLGVKVPIAVGSHERTIHPDNNRGWMTDLYREGDSLFMTCKIIGDDAIEMAPRSDVSLYTPLLWSDGKGNEYVGAITHVLMVTDSVIPGMSDWVPLAASLSNKKGNNSMDLKVLGKALGLSLDKAEKPEELVTEAFKKLQAESDGYASVVGERDKEIKAAIEGVTALRLSLAEAGKKELPEPDPMLLKLAVSNRSMQLDGLLKAGRMTPAVRESMDKEFIDDGGRAIALSLKSGVDDHFDAVVALFAANDPVELREQTGPQTLALQNKIDNDKNKDLLVKDAERRTEEHNKRFAMAR